MLKEFKEFIMKGNLLEIAVGLILALAFKAVVDSLVGDILMQIIAADRSGSPDFPALTLDIGDGEDPLRRVPQRDHLVRHHRFRAVPRGKGVQPHDRACRRAGRKKRSPSRARTSCCSARSETASALRS